MVGSSEFQTLAKIVNLRKRSALGMLRSAAGEEVYRAQGRYNTLEKIEEILMGRNAA